MYSDAAAVRLPEASLMRAMLKPIVTCADAGMSAALCKGTVSLFVAYISIIQ